MLRGTTKFLCDSCGNKFTAPDIEYCATVFSTPQQCPRCGSMHTMPAPSLLNPLSFLQKSVYRNIWRQAEQDNAPTK